MPGVCGLEDIFVSGAEILYGTILTENGLANNIGWVVNPWFVSWQPDYHILEGVDEST